MRPCDACDVPLTAVEEDCFEKALTLPELAHHTVDSLGVICGICSVLEEDHNAFHKGGDREHIHLFPPVNDN